MVNSLSASTAAERWIGLSDKDVTAGLVDEILSSISDDLWVAAACVDRIVDDIVAQRRLIQIGLSRTDTAAEEARKLVEAQAVPEEADDDSGSVSNELDDTIPNLVSLRQILFRRRDMVETYATIMEECNWQHDDPALSPIDNDAVDPLEEIDLDPWADSDEKDVQSPLPSRSSVSQTPTITLSDFLSSPILDSALLLASSLQLNALPLLLTREWDILITHRFALLEAIPLYCPPSDMPDILPTLDNATDMERLPPRRPWRDALDWVETEAASSISRLRTLDIDLPTPPPAPASIQPFTSAQLGEWYINRVNKIDNTLGLVDIELAFVQYGASQGIPGLDVLGEDLSLLSRLVYDAGSEAPPQSKDEWNLARWRRMTNDEVIRSYLTFSTPETIANDLRRLVLPYLYVLEARSERTGTPDPDLVARHLRNIIMRSPLETVAAIFDASKPTLLRSQRLLQKEDEMAQLALACLYSSDSLDDWETMSRIFECLPDWQVDQNAEVADTTLRAMADFVAPSATRPRPTAQDLFQFFQPLPPASLSRALDILDVHLESGEILAKWDVPAPLRWLLQSAHDEGQQRAWATRMARRNATGAPLDDDLEWTTLLKDMLKLAGGKEGFLRGAFGLLSKDQIKRIFFEGLLSLGKFQLAKRLMNPKRAGRPLPDEVIEEVCLSMSREYYDNAASGNLHHGDMKLAYDCLSVAPPTSAIAAEKDFIEATSKICSYGVQSRPGVSLTPLEIRLTKDRLSLVSQLLSSNDDVYKHSEVVLDIVGKLGYQHDVSAEIKALGMMADAATHAEDFKRAAKLCSRMVSRVLERRTSMPRTPDTAMSSGDTSTFDEAVEVCWHTCFQLGRHPEFEDPQTKLNILGHALRLCPSENVLDVLAVWKRVEAELIKDRLSTKPDPSTRHSSRSEVGGMGSLSSQLPSLSSHLRSMQHSAGLPMTSDAAAAVATRTFNRVAGVAANLPTNLPFSLRGRLMDDGDSARGSDMGRSSSSDVSHQAKAAFARGVGWLIGADDD